MIEPWRYTTFLDALDHWQTLLTGVLALVGAIATVFYIHRQIKQADDLENARRRREEIAARAVLPLALTRVVQYAIQCLRVIRDHSARPVMPGAPLGPEMDIPTVQGDVVGALQACVRYGDERVVSQISTLLALLQVQRARLGELISRSSQRPDRRITRFEAMGAMTDAAEVHAKASALFDYGRETADMRARSTREEIDSAFFQVGIVTADENDLDQVLNGRYGGRSA
jgi:hypothetical protein